MGCCQSNSETEEIHLDDFKSVDRSQTHFLYQEDKFVDISLKSYSEETETNQRFTEIPRIHDCLITIRSTSYSLHKNELEQSFLQTKKSFA